MGYLSNLWLLHYMVANHVWLWWHWHGELLEHPDGSCKHTHSVGYKEHIQVSAPQINTILIVIFPNTKFTKTYVKAHELALHLIRIFTRTYIWACKRCKTNKLSFPHNVINYIDCQLFKASFRDNFKPNWKQIYII